MFKYLKIESGWLYLSYDLDDGIKDIQASYIFTDPVKDLIEAVIELNINNESSFEANEEGSEYLFKFKTNKQVLQIDLLFGWGQNKSIISSRSVSIESFNKNLYDFYNYIQDDFQNNSFLFEQNYTFPEEQFIIFSNLIKN